MPEYPAGTSSSGDDTPETAQWTKYLPEAFGLREAVRQSPFRWCGRESALWGIATGSVMGLHRMRMGSTPIFAINVGFATTFLVCIPSYYFCYRKREYKEQMIELMMRANDFQEAEHMPEQVPVEEHPFLDVEGDKVKGKELVAHLPERKEWQTQIPQQDSKDVFKEKR